MTKLIRARCSVLRWSILAGLLLFVAEALYAQDQPPVKASFDCSKGKSLTEKAICSNWDLAFADRVQSVVYKNLIERADISTRERVQKGQLEWIRQRDNDYGLTYKELTSRVPKPKQLNWKLESSLLNAINNRTAALIAEIAALPPQNFKLDKNLPAQYPQDYRRLFGTWKIIAVINDGEHDSGYPPFAESALGMVIRMGEAQCPSTGRTVDQVDVNEWYARGFRASAEEFGFKNYENVMRIICRSSPVRTDISHVEYLFFNDYLMAEGENIWLRIASPEK